MIWAKARLCSWKGVLPREVFCPLAVATVAIKEDSETPDLESFECKRSPCLVERECDEDWIEDDDEEEDDDLGGGVGELDRCFFAFSFSLDGVSLLLSR